MNDEEFDNAVKKVQDAVKNAENDYGGLLRIEPEEIQCRLNAQYSIDLLKKLFKVYKLSCKGCENQYKIDGFTYPCSQCVRMVCLLTLKDMYKKEE